jgi:glucose/mannose-6-phosphate isomerase
MLNIAFDLKNQIISDLESSSNLEKISYENLLIMGMGGSGVAGDVMKLLSNEISDKNIIVHKDYSIPKQVLKFRPLCLFISYSGNTEETLSGISDAKKNNLDWIAISSGGKLIDIAQVEGKEYIKIPGGLQPRAAFGYLTLAISRILDIVEGSDYVSQLNEASSYLDKISGKAEKSDINKFSLNICESINKKTVIIYSGTDMSKVVSSRWKTQINENGKSKAFVGNLPEVHHNEILSWDADTDGSKKNYIVIFIRDKNEHVQISKRFEFTKELIGEKVNIVEVNLNNQESTLKTLLELVLLGDLVSLNLANKLTIDPENIDTIENLKKLLGG